MLRDLLKFTSLVSDPKVPLLSLEPLADSQHPHLCHLLTALPEAYEATAGRGRLLPAGLCPAWLSRGLEELLACRRL